MIRNQEDFLEPSQAGTFWSPSQEQPPQLHSSEVANFEATTEAGKAADGSFPEKRSVTEITMYNSMATIEDVEGDAEDSAIDSVKEGRISPETSTYSGSAKPSYSEWKDKSGLLHAPRNTGSPDTDLISDHILLGYGGDTKRKRRRVICDARRIHVVQKELCGMQIVGIIRNLS